MNQTFSGSFWLGMVLFGMLILFILASLFSRKHINKSNRQAVNSRNTVKRQSASLKNKRSLDASTDHVLLKLRKRLVKHFPEFDITSRKNHLLLLRHSKKVAMLTVDTSVDMGRRRLGNVTVVNFHSLPSVDELKIELQGL